MEPKQAGSTLSPEPTTPADATRRGGRALAAIVALLAICGAGAIGGLAVIDARNSVQDQGDAQLLARAKLASSVLGEAMKSDMDAVSNTADRSVLGSIAATGKWPASYGPLVNLLAHNPRLASASVFDVRGVLQGRVPGDRSIAGQRFSQQDYFQSARRSQGVHISRLFIEIGAPKGPVIAYSTQIRSNPSRGVLQAATLIRSYESLTSRYAPTGAVVRVYDASGEIVAPAAQASGTTHEKERVVASALAGRTSTVRSKSTVSVGVPVSPVGWAVVITQPLRIADHDARATMVRTSELVGAMFVLALLAVVAAWRRG
ncbi:MAG: hypothetical protein ACXVPP_10175 [Actinomycetota bacterium]